MIITRLKVLQTKVDALIKERDTLAQALKKEEKKAILLMQRFAQQNPSPPNIFDTDKEPDLFSTGLTFQDVEEDMFGNTSKTQFLTLLDEQIKIIDNCIASLTPNKK